ncbi:hypothetical protein D0T87_15715 [Bacteroides sp. 51]|nr:hypothetical protein [Bacteroides sp. 51]
MKLDYTDMRNNELRIKDMVGSIVLCLLFGLGVICFSQHKHISYLKAAIEQRDSLLNDLIYNKQYMYEY